MSATPPKSTLPAESSPGPGAQLAQARNDLHWTPEDVATRLHLSARQILALEKDDYSSLPGPTYVRGYLKSYALMLGLSPEPVLAAHARLTAKPAQQDFSNIAPQREITSRHHQVRFTTYLVAAIVIGLAIAWWAGRDVQVPAPVAVSPPGGDVAALPAPAAGDENKPQVATQAEAANMPATTVAASPVPSSPAATPPVQTAPVRTVTPVPATAPATTPATAPAQTTATVPAATVAAAPLPAGPRAKVVLTAEQDTWVDIRDARQVKLLYETVPAGRVVTLEGVAPIKVFLGNAAGARLDFNGKPVDVASHKRGMVARFTLGEQEASVAPSH